MDAENDHRAARPADLNAVGDAKRQVHATEPTIDVRPQEDGGILRNEHGGKRRAGIDPAITRKGARIRRIRRSGNENDRRPEDRTVRGAGNHNPTPHEIDQLLVPEGGHERIGPGNGDEKEEETGGQSAAEAATTPASETLTVQSEEKAAKKAHRQRRERTGRAPARRRRNTMTKTTERGRNALLQRLNAKQREAVTAPDGPVLVIAGPGSGKTRVIITRIAHLIESGRAQPRNIAAITFTRKAAGEMSVRLQTMLPPHITGRVWISTFHRLCGSLLRQHGTIAGVRADFGIADDAEQTNIMRQCMFDAGIDIRIWKPQTLVQQMSVLKNRMKNPADPDSWGNDEHAKRNAWLCHGYQGVLDQSNKLDFDDMLLKALQVLREGTEAREAAGRRLRCILVDEWQDTNIPQYLLVWLIAREHQNLFVVGDPDQAIYGWRGAEIRNILDFQRDFPDARRIDLDIAYRSTAHLLQAARAMIRRNKERIEHTLTPAGDDGVLAGVHDAIDATDEAAFAVDRAMARISRDNGTIAVLYRTNAQSRGFETGFKRAGIPYTITGGKSFYDRPEVQDTLSCLQAAWDPDGDDAAMRRFAELPPYLRLGKKGAAEIDQLQGPTFWRRAYQAVRSELLPEWQTRSLAQRFQLAKVIGRTVRNQALDEALETVLHETRYLDALEQSADPDASERAENVWELIFDAATFLKDWGEDGNEGPKDRLEVIAGFLEHCQSMRTPEVPETNVRVTLSTLHRVKGLEFDTVIIAGFDAEHLPSRKAVSNAESDENAVVEEERRLAYVGMTRARTELYLSVPRMIGNGGRQRPTHPSPFLEEIPPALRTKAPTPTENSVKSISRRPDKPDRATEDGAGSHRDDFVMGPYGPEVRLP